MTALATNKTRQTDGGGLEISLPVAAGVVIYEGSAVVVNATGYAKAVGPVAGEKFRGVSIDKIDNTDGADGALRVRVLCGRSFLFAGTGFARTNEGDRVWLSDDNTVTLTKGAVIGGTIKEFVSSTSVYVYAPPAATIDELLSDDSTAIHEDTAGEIAGVTAKATPVANDLLLIEDSAAANVKKRATAVTLVAGAVGATAAAAVATSNVGAGDAGKLVKLDAQGKVSGRVLETDGSKLDGIEASADVTDLTNVTTALGVTATAAVATSAGAGDAGKAAKLDGSGLWDSTMIPAGGDSTALHDNVTGEISAITEKNPAVAADLLVIEDSAAANAKKRVQVSNLPVAVAGVSNGLMSSADKTKIDGVEASADVTDLTNVTTALGVTATAAVSTSAGAGDAGKVAKLDGAGQWDVSMIPGSTDATALHDNVSGEISAIAEKNPAVAADLLVIEDSAAANAKKRVQVSNLPAAVAGVSAGLMSSADKTKLDGVEALADVTDLANVSTAFGCNAALAVNTSAGAGDAGKLPKLDANGLLSDTMIPSTDVQAAAVAAGAPSQAEIVAAAATNYGDSGAANLHGGDMFILDDNDSTASFLCFSDGTNWHYAGTIGA